MLESMLVRYYSTRTKSDPMVSHAGADSLFSTSHLAQFPIVANPADLKSKTILSPTFLKFRSWRLVNFAIVE